MYPQEALGLGFVQYREQSRQRQSLKFTVDVLRYRLEARSICSISDAADDVRRQGQWQLPRPRPLCNVEFSPRLKTKVSPEDVAKSHVGCV